MQSTDYKSQSVISTLQNHVSIREFTDEKIPDGLLNLILNAARRSPTSSNLQAYTLVVVQKEATKKELAKLAGNQKHIETCAVFVGVCADISRLERACNLNNKTLAKNLENTIVSTVDASLVGMSLSLAAESVGLGTVMIGGMRNQPKEVSDLLGFPKGVYVVFGMCIGWPDWENVKNQKPRFPQELIIHRERYDTNDPKIFLETYDQDLSHHYQSEGRQSPKDAWTGIISSRFSQPRRPDLRETLVKMGFSFR